MTVNRGLWRERFASLPAWVCPRCQRGSLRLDRDKLMKVGTGPSKALFHIENDPELLEYRFAATMTCQNAGCEEVVVVAGTIQLTMVQNNVDELDLQERFFPALVEPAPEVFPISEQTPNPVANELRLAFGLVWRDIGSAANRLRIAAEAVLTDRGIARWTIRKGKRSLLSLHSRLDRFKSVSPAAASDLLAIKWLGNEGSHATSTVTRESLLDGFELFERVLDRLYVRRDARLDEIAKGLTKRRGRSAKGSPRSRAGRGA